MSRKSQDNNNFSSVIVDIARTCKTIAGGRKFSFRALVVVGDPANSRVGFGIGKALEPSVAVEKATQEAKRSMVSVELKNGTIQHTISLRKGATKIYLQPAAEGTGVIAGGAMRSVLEALGIQNVQGKVYGSRSPMNVVSAVVSGLETMDTPLKVAQRRGKTIKEIYGPTAKKQEGDVNVEN